jgi:hypothetical protein
MSQSTERRLWPHAPRRLSGTIIHRCSCQNTAFADSRAQTSLRQLFPRRNEIPTAQLRRCFNLQSAFFTLQLSFTAQISTSSPPFIPSPVTRLPVHPRTPPSDIQARKSRLTFEHHRAQNMWPSCAQSRSPNPGFYDVCFRTWAHEISSARSRQGAKFTCATSRFILQICALHSAIHAVIPPTPIPSAPQSLCARVSRYRTTSTAGLRLSTITHHRPPPIDSPFSPP